MTGRRCARETTGAAPTRGAFSLPAGGHGQGAGRGRVKTRLAREIGVAGARALRGMPPRRCCSASAHDRRWQTTLAVAPDAASASRMLAARHCAHVRKAAATSAQRMQRIFDRSRAWARCDHRHRCAGHHGRHIARRSAARPPRRRVRARPRDGGYWLVGLRRRPRVLRPFAACAGRARMRSPTRWPIWPAAPLPSWPRSATSMVRATYASAALWRRAAFSLSVFTGRGRGAKPLAWAAAPSPTFVRG